MRKNKVTKVLAAVFLGGALLTGLSATAAASKAYYPTEQSQINAKLAVTGFAVKGGSTDVEATWINVLQNNLQICIEYSTDPKFADEEVTNYIYMGAGKSCELEYRMSAGTNYIRAFLYDGESGKYGPYSAVAEYVEKPQLGLSTDVEKKKITFYFDTNDSDGKSGCVIYRAKNTAGYKKIAKTNSLVFVDKGLEANMKYRYKVCPYIYNPLDGKTTYGDYQYVTRYTWGANLDFHATAVKGKNNQVKLTWKKVSGATVYRIYAYKTENGKERKSDADWVEVSPAEVGKPAGIAVTAVENNTAVQVSWKPVSGAAYYRVYRSRRLSGYNGDTDSYSRSGSTVYVFNAASKVLEDKIPVGTTTIVDKKVVSPTNEKDVWYAGPKQGIYYYYYVQAFASNGKPIGSGDYREYSSFVAKPAGIVLNTTVLAKPTSVKVKAGKGKATLSWKGVSGASGYTVYVSTKKNGTYQIAGLTSKTKMTVKSLKSGKKYYFKVTAVAENAVKANVESPASAVKSAKVK